MSSTPRHPIRLSVYTSDGVYYPREITEADGKLYLIDDDGSVVELNKTAVTKITDAAGTAIGSVDPATGGTVAIPNASTTKRGLVVFGTSTGKAPGTASAGSSDSVARADHVHPVQTSVSGNAGTATKLANAISVGFSGVTGDSFEFDGTTDVTLKITAVPASIVSGLATVGTSGKYSDLSGLPTIYQPATTAPKAAGTAAVGTGTTFARADHVHPAQTTVSGNAGSATKLATARTITVSGVTATGASFDGSADATIAITAVPASIVSGLATVATSGKYSDLSGLPTIYGPSSTTPKAAGTAAVGTGTTFARADHVHPAQTTITGNAGTATKLKSAVTIGLSGVTATAQDFDGSEDVTIPITAVPASIVSGLATVATSGKYSDLSGLPTIYGPSSTTPKAAGTAAVGTGTTFARADHVHPAQTTITGNAGSATKLASAVDIKLSGGATGTGSFDGSGDTTINVTALDGSKITGTIPLASIPKGAQERLIVVADDTARLALTSSGAQNGDVIKVESTGIMYYIVDDTAMGSEDAFSVFTAGAASSVAWSGITGKPSTFTPASHKHSTDDINSGTFGVARGGTGATTFTSGAVLIGNGTGAIQTRAIDTTSGGTSGSTSLITSGAVFAGLSGKANSSHGTHVTYGTAAPVVAGTASAGSAASVSRSDHVHPAQTSVSGNAGTATKLKSAVSIGLSGVTATAQEFDGSGNVTIPITAVPASIVSGLATVATSGKYSDLSGTPSIPSASSTTPKAAGTAAVGTGTTWARADHVHPAQTTITGNAGSATKVNSNLIIKLNGGTTEGTNLFTFNGSGAKTVNITPSAIGAAASSHTHSYAGSSSAGGAANSVANSIVIKLNSGSTEGTNLFTFNGSAAKTINITPAGIGAAASSHGTHVSYGTAAPAAAGTASAGSASTVSRSDHVHPAQTTISGNAGSATKVNNNLIIKLNSGTTEGTNLFTFNGSAAKTINITPSAIGAAASSHGTHVSFSTTNPVVAGTAAVGTATTVSRSDHVHPAQTSVSGNAGTATKFAAAQSVTLTGDVTGTKSSQAGWSIATTLANSGVTAGSYGPSANASPAHKGTFTVPYITVDAKGRVTAASTKTITLPADNNTTYSPATLGFGRGTCSTAYATVAKSVTLSGYALVTGGMVVVQFTYGVPAGATLKVNSKGAKAIYHGTAAIKDGVIKAGDTATFVYNGTYYYLVSVASGSNTYTASITTTWSGSAAPYTQTITVSGMSANDNPIVDIVPDSDYDTAVEQMYEYNKIYRITTALNSITVYATEPTEVAIPIQLKCVKA